MQIADIERARSVSAAGELAETLDKATIMLDLVGDNQLAALKVSNRQIVSRALVQSVRYLFFESQVSPFQVGNGRLRHDYSPAQSHLQHASEREIAKTSLT
jgi:hypothetical protein